MIEGIDDQQLLNLLTNQYTQNLSPKYNLKDNQFDKISENEEMYSELSDDDEDIQIPIDPELDKSEESMKSERSYQRKSRWKYCCQKCTKQDKGQLKPKTCVCIVPASQRRILIGEQGCLTCHCTGCSLEDKKYKKKLKKKMKQISSSDDSEDFETVNGCCKKCMKAFQKKGNKACLCQVPKAVRRKPLPAHGCQYCGCLGCNPEDKKNNKESRYMSPVSDDQIEQGLNNFQDKPLIQFMNAQNINQNLLGIGIPQRTFSYIYGRER